MRKESGATLAVARRAHALLDRPYAHELPEDPLQSIESEWRPPDEFEEYRLVRLRGRGAVGEVYLARDPLPDRPVAVKFARAEDPVARARLFDEARAIARLQHPNVVAIYRVAEV